MKYISEFSNEIKTYQVDFKNDLTLESLFMMMQDCAGDSASSLGVGKSVLDKNGVAWILSRIEIKIEKLPKSKDKIIIQTWPNKPMMTFHPRSFRVLDKEQEVIMEANTVWTILDLENRKLSTIDLYELGYPADLEPRPIIPLPKKINVDDVICDKVYNPKYSDMDCNYHMNNTKYIELLFNTIPIKEIIDMKVKGIVVNYQKEIRYNDVINLGYNKVEDGYVFAYKVNDELCFSAKLIVEKGE